MARVLTFTSPAATPTRVDLSVDDDELQQNLATLRTLRPLALWALANSARTLATKVRKAAARKRRDRH